MITHIISDLDRRHGGPSYSVPRLVQAVASLGVGVRVRSISPQSDAELAAALHALSVSHAPGRGVLAGLLRSSPDLYEALIRDATRGDLLHTHGLWLMPNVYASRAKRYSRGRTKLVHSPRGMLGAAALRISAWKKVPFWLLFQRRALEAADCLHATAPSEHEEIRAQGLKGPVAIIPNGVDLPVLEKRATVAESGGTVLSLGRIHPKKGLSDLVRAWASLEDAFPRWKLRIVGNGELGHDDELRRLSANLGCHSITIEGPQYDAEKLSTLRRSDIFVLPTRNENFGMVVAEALAAEVPVISTKGAPWSGLETNGCGWWIDHGVEALTAALRDAMLTPRVELRRMGRDGRAWMSREFGWDEVGRRMIEVYRWLQAGGDPPQWVRLD